MTSYSGKSCEIKINEYKKYIKEEKFKGLNVVYTDVPKVTEGYIYKRRMMLKESPIELRKDGELICEISVREIQGSMSAIEKAHGKCGVLGLGFGYFINEILQKENVTEVIVYEYNKDIIDLYIKNFGENSKLTIVYGDGFIANSEKFDFFFTDIYSYQIPERIAEDYKKLINLHDIYEYSFFGVEKFLLSCPMEQLLMIYIPDEWMEMTRATYDRVDSLGQVKNIRKLRFSRASKLLEKFKVILDKEF